MGNLLWIEMINIFHNHFTQNILLATEYCILMNRHHFCFHIRLFFNILYYFFSMNCLVFLYLSPISINIIISFITSRTFNVVFVCFWMIYFYFIFTTKFPFKFLWFYDFLPFMVINIYKATIVCVIITTKLFYEKQQWKIWTNKICNFSFFFGYFLFNDLNLNVSTAYKREVQLMKRKYFLKFIFSEKLSQFFFSFFFF